MVSTVNWKVKSNLSIALTIAVAVVHTVPPHSVPISGVLSPDRVHTVQCIFSEINKWVMDTVVQHGLRPRTHSNSNNSLDPSVIKNWCVSIFSYWKSDGNSYMQQLLICGRFIWNDGQSQAPSFDCVLSNTQCMHTHMYIAASSW